MQRISDLNLYGYDFGHAPNGDHVLVVRVISGGWDVWVDPKPQDGGGFNPREPLAELVPFPTAVACANKVLDGTWIW